ncbi:MAG: RNA polymerase factor sigma-54 [Candidatus Omnitrophica bacterium]|nr:RNA polymerase factor sigma-54 [Candidatus Omnitrophota bacterium]
MAPNISMALEVLRMAAMELQTFLYQQAEENPFLELDEPEASPEASDAPDSAPKEAEEDSAGLDAQEDWTENWRNGGATEEADEEENRRNRLEQRLTKTASLHESLCLQLGCQPLGQEERRLGEALLRQLDDSGYLSMPLEELAASLSAAPQRLEAVLRVIQRLDPPGVGARDLRECLMLQLEQADQTEHLAYRILRDHFPLFSQHRLALLAKATGATSAQVEEACGALKRLNPRPGSGFADDLPPSVTPDLILHRREGHFDVELNDEELPHVLINRHYHRMLRNPRTPPEAKEFLAQKFRQASWVIKAIEERNATLLAIARCLISLQPGFLEHGPRALRPLTQAQVAGLIGRNPSTVSRAIAGKTMETPYGIFRLEQLFPSGVPQGGGASAAMSDEQIKSELEQLVQQEDPGAPLSDEALVQRLKDRHICVARRTVAKYRTSLKILPAYLRKRPA